MKLTARQLAWILNRLPNPAAAPEGYCYNIRVPESKVYYASDAEVSKCVAYHLTFVIKHGEWVLENEIS